MDVIKPNAVASADSGTTRGTEGHRAPGTREKERPMITMGKTGLKWVRARVRWAGMSIREPRTTFGGEKKKIYYFEWVFLCKKKFEFFKKNKKVKKKN